VKPRTIAALAALPVAAALLAGCGSYASSHDNAAVNQELRNGQAIPVSGPGPVTRIDTPGNFPAIVRVCDGTDGLYVSESSTGIVTVVPYDPACGWKGGPSGATANNTVGPQGSGK
jgi:hypothetical protein